MRYLLDPRTREARLRVLRLRWRALHDGDDVACSVVVTLYLGYTLVLSLPGSTTALAPSMRLIHDHLGGDVGLGAACFVLFVATILASFELISPRSQAVVWLTSTAFLVALGVLYAFGNPLTLGTVISLIFVRASLWAYLRVDRA